VKVKFVHSKGAFRALFEPIMLKASIPVPLANRRVYPGLA